MNAAFIITSLNVIFWMHAVKHPCSHYTAELRLWEGEARIMVIGGESRIINGWALQYASVNVAKLQRRMVRFPLLPDRTVLCGRVVYISGLDGRKYKNFCQVKQIHYVYFICACLSLNFNLLCPNMMLVQLEKNNSYIAFT